MIFWFLERIVVPLVIAGSLAYSRWGEDNIGFIVGVPVIVLIFRMTILSWQRPSTEGADRRVRDSVASWHALEIVALLFLMVFEAGVAVLAEGRDATARSWGILIGYVAAPYVLALIAARWYWVRAAQIRRGAME